MKPKVIWWVSEFAPRNHGVAELKRRGIKRTQQRFADGDRPQTYFGLRLEEFEHLGDPPLMERGAVMLPMVS